MQNQQPVGGYTQIYQQRVAPDSHIKKKINHFLVKNITILHIKKENKKVVNLMKSYHRPSNKDLAISTFSEKTQNKM